MEMPETLAVDELDVFKIAFKRTEAIFATPMLFPAEARCRRSWSVCADIAEAWRNRRDAAHFMSKVTVSGARPRY